MRHVFLIKDIGGVAFAADTLQTARELAAAMHSEETADMYIQDVPMVETGTEPALPMAQEVMRRG